MAIILFMGKVSGAHLNPAVSIAFALRRDFPWWRVPGYIVVQLARRRARGVVPPGRRPRVGDVRLELPGERLLERRRAVDGDRAHVRARQRHPRHRIRRAEHRHHRCARRRRLHRARRTVGKPDLGRVDEPGTHLRPRRRRRRLPRLLGVRRRPARRARPSRSAPRSSSAAAAVAAPAPEPHKARSKKRSPTPTRHKNRAGRTHGGTRT